MKPAPFEISRWKRFAVNPETRIYKTLVKALRLPDDVNIEVSVCEPQGGS